MALDAKLDDLLSPRQIQTLLGIGKKQSYHLAHEIGLRLGGRLVVPRKRLNAWLAGE